MTKEWPYENLQPGDEIEKPSSNTTETVNNRDKIYSAVRTETVVTKKNMSDELQEMLDYYCITAVETSHPFVTERMYGVAKESISNLEGKLSANGYECTYHDLTPFYFYPLQTEGQLVIHADV